MSAFAARQSTSIDVSNLSSEQIEQINKQISEMKPESSNVSAKVRKEAEAWGDLGTNMGKAMVSAAREVGIASNEFASTNLGKIVVAVITYKIVGKDILGIAVGSLILLLGYSLAIWCLTTRRWSEVKYENVPVLWGLFTRAKIVSSTTAEDIVVGKLIGGGGLIILTSVVGLSTIF